MRIINELSHPMCVNLHPFRCRTELVAGAALAKCKREAAVSSSLGLSRSSE